MLYPGYFIHGSQEETEELIDTLGASAATFQWTKKELQGTSAMGKFRLASHQIIS